MNCRNAKWPNEIVEIRQIGPISNSSDSCRRGIYYYLSIARTVIVVRIIIISSTRVTHDDTEFFILVPKLCEYQFFKCRNVRRYLSIGVSRKFFLHVDS